jgi:transposase-like protein
MLEEEINSEEGIVSLFKPWLARHRGVNKRNLHLYTATFQMLCDMRDLPTERNSGVS